MYRNMLTMKRNLLCILKLVVINEIIKGIHIGSYAVNLHNSTLWHVIL